MHMHNVRGSFRCGWHIAGVCGWPVDCCHPAGMRRLPGRVRDFRRRDFVMRVARQNLSGAIVTNSVVPGLIEAPRRLDATNSMGPKGLERAVRLIPPGRVGPAEETARAIRSLPSEDARYVTGQRIVVDGGLTVRRPA